MLYSALSWVFLAVLPGASESDLPRGLSTDEEATLLTEDAPSADATDEGGAGRLSFSVEQDSEPPVSYADLQNPPPQPPPQNPPPPRNERREFHEPPNPVTLSVNGRIPFPLGSARFGSFSGGSTVNGQRVAYGDLFKQYGYGGAAELAFMKSAVERSDWEERDADGRPRPIVEAWDRHASGLYLAGQFDTFRGDTVAVGGSTLRLHRMDDETVFIGFKSYEPWGGGLFTEFRVGGGAIHYANTTGALTTAGAPMGVNVFRNTWGPAGEVAARIGVHLSSSFSIFVGGEGLAAEGPREGRGLPFSVSTNTFFAAAAEAGIEIGY